MCHKLDFKLKYLLASTYNCFEEKPVNSKNCTLGSLQNSSTNFPIELFHMLWQFRHTKVKKP